MSHSNKDQACEENVNTEACQEEDCKTEVYEGLLSFFGQIDAENEKKNDDA